MKVAPKSGLSNHIPTPASHIQFVSHNHPSYLIIIIAAAAAQEMHCNRMNFHVISKHLHTFLFRGGGKAAGGAV